jgi:flagellar basal body-associated protein FliL
MSTRNAEELNTADGKKTLSADIAAQLRMPFTKGLAAPEIAGVFFTAFVIQ